MKVYARHSLVDGELRADELALLLEGSWPRGESALRRSLDEIIDARHAWIDDEASRLSDQLAQAALADRNVESSARPGPAYLHELKLRYYLVKLLRVIAFFEEVPPSDGEIELVAARRRDQDYADLFISLAATHR